MAGVDAVYAELLRDLLAHGERVTTRNAPVRRLCVRQAVFAATPLVSARRVAWRNALREMEWFLSGSDLLADLHPAVRHWWAPWADAGGRVRHNYGTQFRRAAGCGGRVVDQVGALLDGLRRHPFSRRHVLTTWNAADMTAPDCPITNCHNTLTQAFVGGSGGLSLYTYQRSADVVCGLPHNWVQAWALLLWLASSTGLAPARLTWCGGDVHLYEEHAALASRVAALAAGCGPAPGLVYRGAGNFRADDFTLDDEYRPACAEPARMVV